MPSVDYCCYCQLSFVSSDVGRRVQIGGERVVCCTHGRKIYRVCIWLHIMYYDHHTAYYYEPSTGSGCYQYGLLSIGRFSPCHIGCCRDR